MSDDDFQNAITDGYTFSNVTDNHTIRAFFERKKYTISVTSNEFGSASIDSATVTHGSNVKIKFFANEGYHLDTLIINGIVYEENMSPSEIDVELTYINVMRDLIIEAIFKINTYTINGRASTGGSISPPGNSTVNHGEDLAYIITPDTGYKVKDVKVDGTSIGAVDSYTFADVTENHTIYVSFEVITYIVSASSDNNGTISPIGDSIVNYGESITYTFAPNTGFKVKDVKVDGVSVGTVGSYTFTKVTDDHTIQVEFEVKQIPTTLSSDGQGYVYTNRPLDSVSYGDEIVLYFNPEEGWEVDKVYVNGVAHSVSNNELTFTCVDESINIQVIFKETTSITIDQTTLWILIGTSIGVVVSLVATVVTLVVMKKRKHITT